jgi:hypothetical protein
VIENSEEKKEGREKIKRGEIDRNPRSKRKRREEEDGRKTSPYERRCCMLNVKRLIHARIFLSRCARAWNSFVIKFRD